MEEEDEEKVKAKSVMAKWLSGGGCGRGGSCNRSSGYGSGSVVVIASGSRVRVGDNGNGCRVNGGCERGWKGTIKSYSVLVV